MHGSNGRDFNNYKEVDGSPKLFDGNVDGFAVKQNSFEQPIIARYIKINPTRWAEKIAMRVELYGCDYKSDTLFFDGSSMLKRSYHGRFKKSSIQESIRFRFKTNHENGACYTQEVLNMITWLFN